MNQTGEKGSHLEKWVTEKFVTFKKWVTLSKMGHAVEKHFTFEKMSHTGENGSHLEKWVTL